jgi:hypothetical protein
VRTESDLQWSHHSGAPGCHRCGLPLLDGATFCPYCERRLRETPVTRLLTQGRRIFAAGPEVRRVAGIPEPALLATLSLIFAVIAIASGVAAVLA